MGVAIGTAVHSQVAALVGTLIWIFLVENLLVGLLGLVDADGSAGTCRSTRSTRPTAPAVTTSFPTARRRGDPRLDSVARRLRHLAHPSPRHQLTLRCEGGSAGREGRRARAPIDSLAYGGNGVARLNGFVVFVRRGLPGDTVRARVTKVKRNHAEALATEMLAPGPRARRRAVRALPGVRRLPLPGPRLRRAARGEGRAGRGRAAPARRDRRPAARADRPGRFGLPLPEQDGVLVHAVRGRADARPAQGRPLGRGARDRAVLAHDRARQRDPQRRSRVGARGGARRRTTRRPARATSATSSSARGGTPARCSCSS